MAILLKPSDSSGGFVFKDAAPIVIGTVSFSLAFPAFAWEKTFIHFYDQGSGHSNV